ncbi:amidohydrolase [Evansella sp. AB-rgal1]|uniref:amidohydrolase n=1 Tax=Evansella sp. AB-rgal1 TaxID=3242696 RepID=UPI00359E177F
MGTLWYGGKIRTLQHETHVAEAVYVKNGKIVEVGTKTNLEDKFQTEITDYQAFRGVMYPGFVDSHLHMIGHGEKLIRLDLSEVCSIEQLNTVLKKAVDNTDPNTWVIGEGFNENLFPDKVVPNRLVLDKISTRHPIYLSRVCRHAAVTNTYGLQLANIHKQTENPPGGVIEKDEEGNPTGYLLDQAQELLKEVMPKKDFTYVKKALVKSLEDLYENGFVGGHTEDLFYYGDPVRTLTTFYEVIDGEQKKFRANLLVHHEALQSILAHDQEDHPYVVLDSVKIFADGALGGRTALLSVPYSDDPTTSGVAIHSQEELDNIVQNARKVNMSVAIHVIGDLALEYAVNSIEKYPVSKGKRDRLIHLQVTREDLIERLKKLSVVLDIQPRFVASDFPWVQERLGEERMPYSFAWKTLLQAGLHCAGGSDAPIEPVNPLLGIHAAVTRRKLEETHEGYGSSEKLTLFESLQLFTNGSATAIGKEGERGVIEEGYTADFTVLSDDLFELEPDAWLNVQVYQTIVDNSIMYEKVEEPIR